MNQKRPARRPPRKTLGIRVDQDIAGAIHVIARRESRTDSRMSEILLLEALRARRIAGVKVERT